MASSFSRFLKHTRKKDVTRPSGGRNEASPTLERRLALENLESRDLLSVSPVTGELPVNTITLLQQLNSPRAVAVEVDGDFVVTYRSDGPDGDVYGIFAQRFNAAGVKVGTETQVNTSSAGNQINPAIAMDADGDYVIAWEGAGSGGATQDIFFQRFNANGDKVGTEVRANNLVNGIQSAPDVAMDAAGNFVVTWWSFGEPGLNTEIKARRFNSAGVALGNEFQVNTVTTFSDVNPLIGMDNAGNFVIGWDSMGQDGAAGGVYAQRFAADGSTIGGQFRVNQTTAGDQALTGLASSGGGEVVFSWTSVGQDGSGTSAHARRYGADGLPLSNEFRLNSTTIGNQGKPTVAMDAVGNFIATWESVGQDGNGTAVVARQFSATGAPVSDEFLVNVEVAGNQLLPSVGLNPEGRFVIAWTGGDSGVFSAGVLARVFAGNAPPIAGLVGPAEVVRGEPTPFALTALDTPNDLAAGFTFRIDWNGDGIVDETAAGPSGTIVNHIFSAAGATNVRVFAEDAAGGAGPVSIQPVSVVPYALRQNGASVDLIWGGTDGIDATFFVPFLSGVQSFTFIENSVGFPSQPLGARVIVHPGVTGRIVVFAQGQSDLIVNFGAIPASIDGGAGDDVLIGGSGAELIVGGEGNDLIIGATGPTDGDDTLIGGNGNDILIGQQGADVLIGGAGSDLLIAGVVQFADLSAAVYSIRSEWLTPRPLNQRVEFLSGTSGGLNGGTYLIPSATALADGAVDILLGGAEDDWFLYQIGTDFVADVGANDVATNVS